MGLTEISGKSEKNRIPPMRSRIPSFSIHNRARRKNFLLVLILSAILVTGSPAAEEFIATRSEDAFADLLARLNGDIFWAPASGFTADDNWVNIFGDEARSVFGPIPDISCAGESSFVIEAEVDGNLAVLEQVAEGDHLFRHKNADGNIVAESEEIGQCDKPSLANTQGHPCNSGSRIINLSNPSDTNVDWVVLCRKNELNATLTSEDDYWHSSNPYFALLGVIGFNSLTGEVVFFDGRSPLVGHKKISTFNWATTYPPPGGLGYGDLAGRMKARALYSYNRRIKCETCHDNKEPWIVTPHLGSRGFGYRDRLRESQFGAVNVLPLVQPRTSDSPYRVIGTRFTKLADFSSKTFEDPTGSCTTCHTLTTGWTGKVLAYDAVGRINENWQFKPFFDRIQRSLTDWAKQEGNTHPWMVPWLGPNVQAVLDSGKSHSEIDNDNWSRIAACINETSSEDCQYKSSYTSCPPPESLVTECSNSDVLENRCAHLTDPFGPSEMATKTTFLGVKFESSLPHTMQTTISWTYLNGLGGVPQRDDVRFNLAIKEVDGPKENYEPPASDFPLHAPTIDPFHSDPEKAGAAHYCDFGTLRKRNCHILDPLAGEFLITNISHSGHIRNTTPDPTHEPRHYQVVIPTQCNKRYLVRLVPKRFCFDRSGVLASKVDHVTYFDVRCAVNIP